MADSAFIEWGAAGIILARRPRRDRPENRSHPHRDRTVRGQGAEAPCLHLTGPLIYLLL
ncbi:hypothetical protein H6F46_03495 [Limnothrix sp. FACHB-1083]|uniref:hypothetical protein n=1 Tax=unclassified Limnothrix TaxID=2632864 RepID=UPI001680580A|nr:MULTISPECIES: hypothetical protein [unclassified Limnothrix]MBD2159754.1 hypothetical protein [Limnothrix sp. FACHB-1083]MBD2190457.1 hypothetical protein [Limnothrix sp. FACHB-1088]